MGTSTAAAMAKAGAGVVIADADLSGPTLADAILALYRDEEQRRAMAEASQAWGRPESALRIAQLLTQM